MNEKDAKTLLEEELVRELEDLGKMEHYDNETEEATKNIVSLYRLHLDTLKTEAEIATSERARKEESCARELELKNQKIERRIRVCMGAVELFVPLIFYGVWMSKGLKFEKDGTFTSLTFKNLISRFKPTKKS